MNDFLTDIGRALWRVYRKTAEVMFGLAMFAYLLGCFAAQRPLGFHGFDAFLHYVVKFAHADAAKDHRGARKEATVYGGK